MLKLRSSRAISSVVAAAAVVVCASEMVSGGLLAVIPWFGRYSSSGISVARYLSTGISDASTGSGSAFASVASSGASDSAANGLGVLIDSAVGVMIFGFPFITSQRCYRGS